VAQSDVALMTRKAELKALSATLKERDAADRARAREFARSLGIPMRRELPNGRILELQRIAPGIGPVFYITNNVDAADTVSTDEVWPGGSAGLLLDGSGMTVGEWDGGAVFATHTDLIGRVTQVDGVTNVSAHSTHVAGTLIGAGAHPFYPQARGMAYAANLNAYDWNSDTAEMALAASNGLLVSNHSYGIAAGWLYIGDAPPDTWWWIGGANPGDIEDPNFGYYDSEAQLWDQIAHDAPYYLVVKASGNDRWDSGPVVPGEEYTIIDQQGEFVATSTLPRNADCAPAGYDCLPGHSVAKNILTVGAVDDLVDGYAPLAGPSQVQMAGFSGWGPTDDGRIKPDVVGSGIWLVSTWPDPPHYAAALGTSMASPNVTGSLVLLQEHYENLHGNDNFMRAATLKALAIHSADEAGDADGPDYAFGWGLLNTQKAAQVITEDGGNHRIIEDTLLNGGVDTVEVVVSEADRLIRATLVWSDPPGTPPAPSLDPPDPMLVNDLDLRVRRGPTTWLPWVLNPAAPADGATTGDNVRDNVEQVVADAAATGSYFVEVRHKGTLLDSDPQDYSLIISVGPAPSTDTSLLIDENFSAGLPPGWSINTEQGDSWAVIDPVPGDQYRDNKTGGSGKFAIVDNQFTRTKTSLILPAFNLADATGVILSFDSSMQFSDLERINVDVSTDGGSSWTNTWWRWGLIGLPHHYVEDLTPDLAGQANARIRFRYDTFGSPDGYYWQIDNVQLQAFGLGGPPPVTDPPAPANGPFPADGESGLASDVNLNWSAGAGADSHDVYFGTASSPPAMGNQNGTGFDPGPLDYDTTYYWRIDEVNEAGTTAGAEWGFTTMAAPPVPGQASNPGPANGAVGIGIDDDLVWTAGSNTESHNVFFGTSSPPAFQGNQPGTGFEPGTLLKDTTYHWRIDEVNSDGITTGSEWIFTTESATPAPVADIHLKNVSGASIPSSRGRWHASVLIEVVTDGGAPASGVLVEGAWSNGANGGASCTTIGGGQCSVEKSNLKSNVSSVAFAVTNLSGTDMNYDSGANEASNATTVFKDGGGGDLLPNAVNDSFSTAMDTPLNGNVMSNDSPGDAPAIVTVDNSLSAQGGSVTMNDSGDFTYTPPAGFEGTDSFSYTIEDSDGDSDSATVTVTVDPAPGGGLVLSATSSRNKGTSYADLTWSGGNGTGQVTIRRNGALVTDTANNNGSWSEELGKKVSGDYIYQVCENVGGACAEDTIQF
jgi:hypothetical protein